MKGQMQWLLLIGALFVIGIAMQSGVIKVPFVILGISTGEIYFNPVFNTLTCEKLGDRSISVPVSRTSAGFFGIGEKWETAEGAGADCTMETGQAGCDYDVSSSPNFLGSTKMVAVSTIDKVCVIGHKPGIFETADFEGCVGDYISTEKSVTKHTPPNTRIKIISTLSFLVQKRFNPLGLVYERGLGGTYVYNSESCRVQKFGSNDTIDISNTICVGDTTGKFCRGFKDTMLEGESVSFFSGEYAATFGKKTLPSGTEGVPIAGIVYGFGEISLKDGTKLQVVDTGKILAEYGIGKALECVPGDSTPTQVCGNDWKWHTTPTAEVSCRLDTECYRGQFAGGWSIDARDSLEQTIVRGACVNPQNKQQKITSGQIGVCNYEFELQEVECTSNFQCSNNTPVCDVGDTYKCIESKATGGGLTQQKEICDDEIDNDGDKKIDKEDEDCQGLGSDICALPLLNLFCTNNQLGPLGLLLIIILIILFVALLIGRGGGGRPYIFVIRS